MKKGKFKRIVINLSLVLGSVIFLALLLEVWFSIFYPQNQFAVTYAPWGFTHQANCSITYYMENADFDVASHPVPIDYNSKGLRDYEYSYQKPDGIFRILVLGDSWAEDMASFFENLYVKRLEKKLNSLHLPIKFEIINAGHYAYGNAQELMYYLNEGRKYSPDLVILVYTGSSTGANYAVVENGKLRLKYKEFSRLQKLYRKTVTLIRANSHLGNFILNRLTSVKPIDTLLRTKGFKEEEPVIAKFPKGHPKLAQFKGDLANEVMLEENEFSLVSKLIWMRFKAEAEKDGGRFVFMNCPPFLTQTNERFLKEKGIDYLAIKWDPEEVKQRKLNDIRQGKYNKFLDSHRFGYKQHPIVAKQIMEFLVENDLLPYSERIRKQLEER